jgi:hypothetical protein
MKSTPLLRPPERDPKFSTNRTRANPRLGGTGPRQNERRETVSSNGPWGDKLKKNKAQSTFRYGFANINGLPAAAHKEKHDRITTTLEKSKIDLLGMAEINVNF